MIGIRNLKNCKIIFNRENRWMKIVFLDESTLHSGEMDLSGLAEFGELTCYPVTGAAEVLERCLGAHTLISNKVVLDEATIAQCSERGLKQIISCATGVNQIDVVAAKKYGVTVQNVAGYSTEAVAQHVFAMILNLATKVHLFDKDARNWPEYPIFTSLEYPIFELKGKVLGIVGLGEIGRAVARVGMAFGMQVQALARGENQAGQVSETGVERVTEEDFYATSDVISLHCPLTETTQGMIDRAKLKSMKSRIVLINTARGPLIVEEDLAQALRSGEIAAAGLDVLSTEPPAADNPLINYKGDNLMLTPHTAWSAQEARVRLYNGLLENLESYRSGSPKNLIC